MSINEYSADSGNQMKYHFRRKCGSPIYGERSIDASGVVIHVVSLDDATKVISNIAIYTDSTLH